MPRGERFTLWCLALMLTLSLYLKGRVPAHTGDDAAFLRPEGASVTVRLEGDFPRPGVYRLPEGVDLAAAIKMTLPAEASAATVKDLAVRPLSSGDVVRLTRGGVGKPVISITKMGVRERMLLGVPLDPDLMSAEEWALLPGIGPVLAGRIVDDRHYNGAFGTVEALARVPGIGPGKLALIRSYF